MATNKQILLSDVDKAIDDGIAGGDQARAESLAHLQTVRRAKDTQLQREQGRLTAKLGADHPRVLALAEKITVNRGLAQEVTLETARAKTEVPAADDQTWIVRGFVRDKNGKGVPKLTIALYGGRERTANWIKELGYACTNDQGYFKLEARNFKSPFTPVYLRVLNPQGGTLFNDANPLTPTAGQVDYREINLNGDAGDCPPPPPSPSEWSVRGRVKDAAGAALPSVTVNLSDKDQVFAARLGKTQTDVAGNFSFTYQADAFRDLIEKKPDLFLQVTGGNLRQPYTHPTALHFEPGRAEVVTIIVNAPPEPLKPWTVRGQVTDSAGKVLDGYTISFVDASQKAIEKLGSAQTDASGKFERIYRSEDFRDLIDQKTKLFVQVSGPALRTPQIHPKELLFTPGGVEELKITVKLDAQEPKTWTVRGQVLDSSGAPLVRHIVTISDKERKFADRLGKTTTGAKGEFEFVYKAEDFADLVKLNLDLILQVLDPNQKLLYTHDKALRFEPGKVETLSITIKRT